MPNKATSHQKLYMLHNHFCNPWLLKKLCTSHSGAISVFLNAHVVK